MEQIEKIFYVPGDIVTIKHDLPNKPKMLVTEVVTNKFRAQGGFDLKRRPMLPSEPKNHFVGIRCGWFTNDGNYVEKIFSTKDLIKVEEGE